MSMPIKSIQRLQSNMRGHTDKFYKEDNRKMKTIKSNLTNISESKTSEIYLLDRGGLGTSLSHEEALYI